MTKEKKTSKCCKAPIETKGMPDFPGSNEICTMHFECTKCGKACDLYEPIFTEDQWLRKQEFMSARDIAKRYGKSHQYWSKILKQGKIWSQNTSAGRITFRCYVDEFIKT